ncbi:hypothetical protein [Halomonas sp. HAL1]|uniref:hypothetical protein n=1 Tax=Halomonas sp. HAL1 TaxID=550984 RepID=UPI00022D3040|nr:hypothetical protein [Halomonas sp. HAL1]EHA13645.1 hypothetical protein HAL1_20385 [Halomonas sp. HAL1]WKV91623.1 hypothetical protein Q3Y66_12095 [Halomonas sp. HAL1]
MSIIKSESPYPVIKVILAYQSSITAIAFLLVLLIVTVYAWNTLGGYGLAIGILTGAIVSAILKSYIEVLEIISDTLMPQ